MKQSRGVRALVLCGVALLGVGLLLNPLYLYPDGGGAPERTYHVTQVENETMAQQALGLSEDVLDCPGGRSCALERDVLENGSVETDAFVYESNEASYSVVRIEGETYVPESHLEENGTVLTLENVTPLEAVERAAVSTEQRSELVRETVETGSITVYGEQIGSFERNEILEHDGDYYYRHGLEWSGGHWTADPSLVTVRVVLTLLGSGLVAYSGWRLREITDRYDSG
ncbi:hypothetical protein [Natronobacterium gregoryi]|uniref:Uncharacterized protein n=2 Tax=Natronobacterium gregoryi TaxID=44930 RepID=L0AIV4_NATGS|nr:hypothetical protein [Natronobacterium gregoryi]AFZ73828.1 hypothetical protein Natgr_2679 [Natronobacterium gregoryi SP2]ELY65075.1 hypothetical protein C490_13935 [Natronobacterium gregoryi SP2]PLK19714.1 hypothetical protein CYV19_13460 [Natronobacterium gregoryi SP2]SFJ41955.1 hypothetical protein SAMN05443661_12817 [Natronobacterium gregoryi]